MISKEEILSIAAAWSSTTFAEESERFCLDFANDIIEKCSDKAYHEGWCDGFDEGKEVGIEIGISATKEMRND